MQEISVASAMSGKPAVVDLQLTAIQGVSEDQVSLAELLELARLAFRTSEDTGCGGMVFEVVAESQIESAFLFLDIQAETLTLRPDANTEADTYSTAVLKFYLLDFPEVFYDVKITSNVELCTVTSLSFSSKSLEIDLELATGDKEITLPDIIAEPACGASYTISSIVFENAETPLEIP